MSLSPFRSRRVLTALAALGVLIAPQEGTACSICRCGDATFNALGSAGYTTPGFRAALDWERFDKDEGDPAEEMESQVENRVTALGSYGLNDRFMLAARVPYSDRQLTATALGEEPEAIHTHGLSDPEVYGQARLWTSGVGSAGQTSLCVTAGVKTPWGENDAGENGERLDEHAQPGTGSTDGFGSVSFLDNLGPESALFASAGYRLTGDNDYGYKYGNTAMANLAYEHRLGRSLDVVAEVDFRHAEKDRVDAQGTLGEDTGGTLLYVTPRMLVDLGRGLVLRAAAQIPVVRDLYGHQTERTVVNMGVTFLTLP